MPSQKTLRKAIASFTIVLSTIVVVAQPHSARNHRLSPSDLLQLRYADDPQISPDGKKVAYVVHFTDIQRDKYCSNIWITNFDGSDARPVTTGNFQDAEPRWSPDGTRIAYVSNHDGKAQLYVLWIDSAQTAKVTDSPYPPSEISWSPDGQQIAFLSFVPVSVPAIFSPPEPPLGAEWAEPPEVYSSLLYHSDTRGYLKPGYSQIFVVSSRGGTARQLTSEQFPHNSTHADINVIRWTTDGKSLVTAAYPHEDYEYHPVQSDICEISLADGSTHALTDGKGVYNAPAISPDGKQIAFTGFVDRFVGHQTAHLYVMNLDGSNLRVLTSSLDRDVEQPFWAPDGNGVYFIFDDHGDSKLGYTKMDGNVQTVTKNLGSGASSTEGGDSFTISQSGDLAFTISTSDDPGDISVRKSGNSGNKILTSLNDQLFYGKKLGTVEELWFNSSLDQRKIQGWIVKPPDFDPSKRYPLILQIHGGPHENYGDRFDSVNQIWAAQGYVVLYLNPRGSTSYGEEFSNLIRDSYPGDDFFDLDSGVDAVLAKGYIDRNELFVTGGSGGGILTCWMIARTTRFRAAASLYPVTNWFSFSLTTDIPSLVTRYWFRGYPWDHIDEYMKQSPISYVNRVKTPTLLMIGDDDFRTPLAEAEQYYTALKLLNVETVLVRFPGENHLLSSRPSHEVDTTLFVLNWFNQHLVRIPH